MAIATDARIIETAVGAAVFALVFLFGARIHPLKPLIADRRGFISFSAGMSAAYVFVHVLPELHSTAAALKKNLGEASLIEADFVYLCALFGFLAFYGLDHLRARLREDAGAVAVDSAFRLHIAGFASYAFLMSYLLINRFEESATSITLFSVAISLHFVTLDHSLRREHGSAYDRVGRFVLSASCVAGWAIGLILPISTWLLALMTAFISGAIIVNSAIMELPTEKDGRFIPFLCGGLLYGLILLPFG